MHMTYILIYANIMLYSHMKLCFGVVILVCAQMFVNNYINIQDIPKVTKN